MKRLWPDEFNYILESAEEVTIEVPPQDATAPGASSAGCRKALKVHLTEPDFQRIWPLAEMRYRLSGKGDGKAITLIANNPHYHKWHPSDGGTVETKSQSGHPVTTRYVDVHFLLDDVPQAVPA
jgi:hypothetical protein